MVAINTHFLHVPLLWETGLQKELQFMEKKQKQLSQHESILQENN